MAPTARRWNRFFLSREAYSCSVEAGLERPPRRHDVGPRFDSLMVVMIPLTRRQSCCLLLFLTFSVLVKNQPEKITSHGGQPRCWWSAEYGKQEQKTGNAPPPPPSPARCSFGENEIIISRNVSTGATQVSVGLASVQGFLRLVDYY